MAHLAETQRKDSQLFSFSFLPFPLPLPLPLLLLLLFFCFCTMSTVHVEEQWRHGLLRRHGLFLLLLLLLLLHHVSIVLLREQWRAATLLMGRTGCGPNLNALNRVWPSKIKKFGKISQILCFIWKTNI